MGIEQWRHSKEQHDHYLAGLVTCLLHASILFLVAGHPARKEGDDGSASEGRGFKTLASFELADQEFRQKITTIPHAQVPSPLVDGEANATPSPQSGAIHESASEATKAISTTPAENEAAMTSSPPGTSPRPDPAPPAQAIAESAGDTELPAVHAGGLSGAKGEAGLMDAYLAALRTKILAKYGGNDHDIRGCIVTLQQHVGGVVLSAKVSGCNAGALIKNELEAAALMAQPLPYSGFESVFSERLDLGLEN